MKFSSACSAAVCLVTWGLPRALAALRGGGGVVGERILQEEETGTFLMADIQYADPANPDGPDRKYAVQLSGRIFDMVNLSQGWKEGAGASKLSGRDEIVIPPGAVKKGGTIDMKGKAPADVPRKPPRDRRELEERQRRLTTGPKTLLAVRVIGADASYGFSEAVLRDKWLGTSGDPVNFKSQMQACSYGKLQISGTAEQGIDEGVVSVTISNTISGASDDDIVDAVVDKLNADYGSASGLADGVALCLPPGTDGDWIGYAYINSWLSVYNNDWCNYLSIQMHEIGHNFGFAHSGETDIYDDQSGLMGFSYSEDDGPVMCFNGPKSWQAQWYTDKQVDLLPGNSFEGSLYGISDYGDNDAQTVLIRINGPGSADDHYIAFNRQFGINSGTQEGGNQVLITRRPTGVDFAESVLVAKLNSGGVDSRGGMEIKVESITSFATVAIAPAPAPPPTNPPPTGGGWACMSGEARVVDVNLFGETKFKYVKDLETGDTIQGLDEDKEPAACTIEAIGNFGVGPVFGNYTEDHFNLDVARRHVAAHGRRGDEETAGNYAVLTSCPVGLDEAEVGFTPFSSVLFGDAPLKWSDYILLHKSLVNIVRKTGPHVLSPKAYTSIEKVKQYTKKFYKTMLSCAKESKKCDSFERAADDLLENSLTEEAKAKVKSAFGNLGKSKSKGSISDAVIKGRNLKF